MHGLAGSGGTAFNLTRFPGWGSARVHLD
jgi:hypothetical protein